jgi:hypothetical protein
VRELAVPVPFDLEQFPAWLGQPASGVTDAEAEDFAFLVLGLGRRGVRRCWCFVLCGGCGRCVWV